ncbi:MAG: choice-of-anchor J domain-containing protein [Muribaculaceae bacterium]|nr:choice-of-anchor J domain-containing protein [Muribaculaceae bacterium]
MKKQSLIIAAFLALGSAAVNGQETTTPPYTQWFDDLSELTIIDANSDGNTWTLASYDPITWSSAGRYTGSTDNGADEWMITPALELKAGYTYKFSINAIGVTGYTNNLEVLLGNAATADAMNTSVTEKIVLTEKVKNAYYGEISVTSDGTYYIGLHLTAEANQGAIYVDDITIEAGLLAAAPAAVSAFTATPAVEEAKAVMKLAFTAPDKTNSGADLTEITNIMVYRGTEKIADMGEQTPGATVEYTDNAPATGSNAYKVICVNTAGEGAEATKNGFLSFSKPAAPANVVLTETEEGQTITWDAVTTGTSTSELFIPENVTYTITRSDNVEIAKGITVCTITDTYTKEGEGQDLISYTVTAINEGGSSAGTSSNGLLVGNPYTGEYAESFSNYSPYYTTSTWQQGNGWSTTPSSYYNPEITADQDGSGAFAKFNTDSYAESRLISPIINVSDMQNPRLSFYIYHSADCSYTTNIVPELLIDGEYIALGEGIAIKGETTGWTKYHFDLTKEQVAKDFQLSFKGVAGQYGYNAAIDNITIKDALTYNLAVTGITAPATLNVGKSAEIAVSIKNTGVNTTTGYQVVLSCNGEEIASINGEELASETTANVVFSYTATPFVAGKELEFSAEVVFANDLNKDDNTAAVTVPVNTNDLPVPTDLKANDTADPYTVVLSWTAPVVPEVEIQPVQTESFETWEVGSTEPFAGWKFVDGDGAKTYDYAYFETSGAMAFLTSSNSKFNPLSGNNYLVSIKNNSYYSYRNDWAISPEVAGGQTISLNVCNYSWNSSYGTTFEICYSTTDNNVESFTAIGDKIVDKSTSWKEYSFTLPENAKYFAIHVCDDGSVTASEAFAIDDIKFQPASIEFVHTGYNVYRDEKKIATIEDKTSTTFTDSDMADSYMLYSYAVSALYETGESLTTDAVTIENPVTGIEDITDNKAVYANNGMLKVIGYAGEQLNVYLVSGQAVVSKTVENDMETMALNAGIYIVSIGDKNFKVVIK